MKRIFAALLCMVFILLTACKEANNSDVNSDMKSKPDLSEESSITEDSTSEQDNSSSQKSLIKKKLSEVDRTPKNIYDKTPDQLIGEQNAQVDRIAGAYIKNDLSLLKDEKDRFILTEATRIINEIIKKDMNDVEKEGTVHDYIVKTNTYDTDAMDELNKVNPDSYGMYGFFKNQKSVCLGYTRSFQLFMDMLQIPCITVHSYYGTDKEIREHAWNMVKLDDKWYHVDVTWDDPVPDKGKLTRMFFNVTSEYMLDTGHDWPLSSYPSATDETYMSENRNKK